MWRATDITATECRAALHADWTRTAIADDRAAFVALGTAIADQGPYAHEPDARGCVPNVDALITVGTRRDDPASASDVPGLDLLRGIARRLIVWRAESHERKRCEKAPTGNSVVMVSFVSRRPALTHDEFAEHWTQRHTPLALRHHIGMCGYRQHVVQEGCTHDDVGVDGVAELEFATRADFATRYYDSDSGKRVIRDDVARFIDLTVRRRTTLVDRVILRDGGARR